ncbi:MAG: hypothetical protein AAGD01_20215 [Acidobacteriota bacterium]
MSVSAPARSVEHGPTKPKAQRGFGKIRRWVQALQHPISRERRALNRARLDDLPEHLQTPQQVLGRGHHSCGATHGVLERCNLACTSCYLTKIANAVPPLPKHEVYRQLDELRAFLGPQGKAQITAGEVTLLDVESLGDYVAYACSIGLDPMVMSHGQRFLDEPEYLEELMTRYGLEKVSLHIDSTQRGRPGWRPDIDEAGMNAVREALARQVRQARRRTGKTLHAAHTITVTPKNLEGVRDALAWCKENSDAFRMVSLQPAAAVGRTESGEKGGSLTMDEVWEIVREGLGEPQLNRHALHFGHPECNVITPLAVLKLGDRYRIFEGVREGKAWDLGFMNRALNAWSGFTTRGSSRSESALAILSLLVRNLPLLAESVPYTLYRMVGYRSWLLDLLKALAAPLRGRLPSLKVNILALVIHRFMSPEEIDTPLGQERLDACVFQVPVDGQMVSMCTLNATDLRAQINHQQRELHGSVSRSGSRRSPAVSIDRGHGERRKRRQASQA